MASTQKAFDTSLSFHNSSALFQHFQVRYKHIFQPIIFEYNQLIIREESKKLVKVLEEDVKKAEYVDLISLSTQFTLNAICEVFNSVYFTL